MQALAGRNVSYCMLARDRPSRLAPSYSTERIGAEPLPSCMRKMGELLHIQTNEHLNIKMGRL